MSESFGDPETLLREALEKADTLQSELVRLQGDAVEVANLVRRTLWEIEDRRKDKGDWPP